MEKYVDLKKLNNIKVIDHIENNEIIVDIVEYQQLLGCQDIKTAQLMYFMSEQNIKVRQITIDIKNSKVRVEAGAMSFFQGNLQMVSGVNLGNALGKMFKGVMTGETMSQPIYEGSGRLVLEPSFRHFLPFKLEKDESLIIDQGMFYMSSESVRVEPVLQKNISSGLLGGEGLFQIKLTGPGVVVCESLVPTEEIQKVDLNNDILKVDGNFVLMRDSSLSFSVERSSKTLIGSAVSGEGFVNVYKGTGSIWIAPTLKIYNNINSLISISNVIANVRK